VDAAVWFHVISPRLVVSFDRDGGFSRHFPNIPMPGDIVELPLPNRESVPILVGN
jgi:hypothetical protein